MKISSVICILFILLNCVCFSQTKSNIYFQSSFGKEKLVSNKFYHLNSKDSIEISSVKFYVSNIIALNKTKTVWQDSIKYHLVDVLNGKALLFQIPSGITFTQIKFNLGIDSITNVSGALSGDLDPTKGMYWTWQSGYINFKLEGSSNVCPTRHNEFQFHLGGYQYPFNSLQTIFLQAQSSSTIYINMDIYKIIQSINLSTTNHMMSPSKEAVLFSEKIIESLSVSYDK